MKKLLLALFLIGCASAPEPITQLPPAEAVEVQRVIDIKNDTLWMYSTGSFGLLCIGLAIIAFAPARRLSGLVFVAGGAVGMTTIWVFETEWFPWVAGGTVGLIALNLLAFAWVKTYRYLFPQRDDKKEQDKPEPQS